MATDEKPTAVPGVSALAAPPTLYPRPAPYDGYRMVEPGEPFALDWRTITDGRAPSPGLCALACFYADADDACVWCCPWPEDPRR